MATGTLHRNNADIVDGYELNGTPRPEKAEGGILIDMTRPLLMLAFAFLACCPNSALPPSDNAPGPRPPSSSPLVCGSATPAPELRATLTLARTDYAATAEVEVDISIENVSRAPVEVDPIILISRPLLLELRDAAGNVVSAGPPPTPSAQTQLILPGEKVHTKLNLGGPGSLPPGEYHVCARTWLSNTVALRIVQN